MYGDVPADCLAIAAELVSEASREVSDPLVMADLSSTLERVYGKIVQKVRNSHTHSHGWKRSSIEALEAFARDEAKKAIRMVLARSRAAVEARRAKERPKKKRARARQRASDAKIKTAKAKGTYKSRTSGDTKIHWKRAATHRDRKRRLKSAYNKVEKYGPGACTPDDIKKHAKHKKILEKTLATYHAARKEGKKRL